jgi:DNA-binding GntR family transcriptional regulator
MPDEHDSSSTAQVKAYTYIRTRILDGRLPGGIPLNPADIALALGCSRIPVREAIRQLDGQGLVSIRPNRRPVITVLSATEVRELFEMRALLESFAARQAVPNMTRKKIAVLDALRLDMDSKRNETHAWIAAHSKFHEYLVDQAERPRLSAECSRMRVAVQPYSLMYIEVYKSPDLPDYEHETIIDAIRSGNSNLVESVVRGHVMGAGQALIDWFQIRARQQS